MYFGLLIYEGMNQITELPEKKGIKETWLAEKHDINCNMANPYMQNRQQPKIEMPYEIAKLIEVAVKDLLIEIKKEK